MPPALSPAARTRLASISKQLKAKFPDSDSRLAAVVYAVYACQAARQTGAFALVPGSADSALLVTLPPGAYTAVLDSPTGAGGVALVEVYEVR